MIHFLFAFSLFIIGFQTALQGSIEEFPVLYQGRYRSVEAYAQLWLYEFYHGKNLKTDEWKPFFASQPTPLTFLWTLEFEGASRYQSAPLFWVESIHIKKWADLPYSRNRFSYQDLSRLLTQEENKEKEKEFATLFASLKEFEQLLPPSLEQAFEERFKLLQGKQFTPKEIESILEHEYPLVQRLKTAGSLFKALPSRYKEGEWLPLKALSVKVYNARTNTLEPVGNFTLYAADQFALLQKTYLDLQNESENKLNLLPTLLHQSYKALAGKVVQKAHGKELTYPSFLQLKVETLYVRYPWILSLILLYGLGTFLFIAASHFNLPFGKMASLLLIYGAVFLHTGLLAMRCYILERPPVSNMFETVLYVPWVAVCVCLLFPSFRRQPPIILAACFLSLVLLAITEVTDLNQSLDQVQAVLDSQFWLMIHVLLVVGSYGLFLLGAILGHFYLIHFLLNRKTTETMVLLSRFILQTLYGGLTLLIFGTILGGIWAAESWGRFWDWDPKESWAFISICFYLIWIHAYRFHKITHFGLAVGAVGGLLAISFTWYGVNYILGTGLHSYGFGSGGQYYYYAFLGGELLFLTFVYCFYLKNKVNKQKLTDN